MTPQSTLCETLAAPEKNKSFLQNKSQHILCFAQNLNIKYEKSIDDLKLIKV